MKRPKLFAVLPTLLTLGNAACGFGAITFAAKVGPENLGTPDTGGLFHGGELYIAAILIFLAMLFDALDGSAARWAKQTSDFGAQLDSLCDGISFGVAPAFLMLQFVRHNPHVEGTAVLFDYHPRVLWVIAVLFVVFALLRLARFNVETDEDDSHDDFSGLPSPAAAGVVASFPVSMRGLKELALEPETVGHTVAVWLIPAIKVTLPWITLAVACLMVSRIRYPHVFNQLFRGQRSAQHMLQLVVTALLIFAAREMAVPLIFCFFAFASPVRALWTKADLRRLYKWRGL